MSSNKQEIIEHQGRTGEGARPLSGGGGLVRLGRSGGGGREGSPGLVLPRRPKRMSAGALFSTHSSTHHQSGSHPYGRHDEMKINIY